MSIGGSPESFEDSKDSSELSGEAVEGAAEEEGSMPANTPGQKAVRDLFQRMTENLQDKHSAE